MILEIALRKAYNALGVIALDPKIREFLLNNDPKALQQCEHARSAVELQLEPWQKPDRGSR